MKLERLVLLVFLLGAVLGLGLAPVEPAAACYTCGTLEPNWGNPPEAFCLGDARAGDDGWYNCVPMSEGGCVMFFRCDFWDVSCD